MQTGAGGKGGGQLAPPLPPPLPLHPEPDPLSPPERLEGFGPNGILGTLSNDVILRSTQMPLVTTPHPGRVGLSLEIVVRRRAPGLLLPVPL